MTNRDKYGKYVKQRERERERESFRRVSFEFTFTLSVFFLTDGFPANRLHFSVNQFSISKFQDCPTRQIDPGTICFHIIDDRFGFCAL